MSEDFNRTQNNIQWFPGHMMKTLRLMEAEMKNVDAVLQLLDARIPFSSVNPEIEKLCANKPKLYALNKADLADPQITEQWIRYFKASGAGCLSISSKTGAGMESVKAAVDRELQELILRRQQKGIHAKLRIMITGIPNVGKSTFINTFTGHSRAKTADKPGVTRGKQWISCDKYDLLDMPGVLWKKFDSAVTASNLAFIGSINDNILDIEEIAVNLIGEIKKNYPVPLCERYKLNETDLAGENYEILLQIGRNRGMLLSGGDVNTERAAIVVCDEFRSSKLGRISLERP